MIIIIKIQKIFINNIFTLLLNDNKNLNNIIYKNIDKK